MGTYQLCTYFQGDALCAYYRRALWFLGLIYIMNLIDMNSQDIKVRLGESANFLAVIYFEKKKSDMRKKNKIKVI